MTDDSHRRIELDDQTLRRVLRADLECDVAEKNGAQVACRIGADHAIRRQARGQSQQVGFQ